jgi:hypothetical protein
VRGQPSQRLSAHYRLECDYGTAFSAIYKEGDAFFLCDTHATAFNPADRGTIAGVRIVADQSIDDRNPSESVHRPPSPENRVDLGGENEPRIPAASQNRNIVVRSCISNGPAIAEARTGAGKPASKAPIRDLAYGDSAKALVDEAIWNIEQGDFEAYRGAIQQGKSVSEAAEAAGGQLAIIHRRIKDYTLKTEAILSESQGLIDVRDAIDKTLERSMLEIIENTVLNQAEKDAAIHHLGALQEWIGGEFGGQLSPLRAHRLARAIGDRANWGIGPCPVEALSPAYSSIYTTLRNAILLAVPTATSAEDRLANLCAAKSDLESDLSRKAYCGVTTFR